MSPLKLSLFAFVAVFSFSSLGCIVYTRPRPVAVVGPAPVVYESRPVVTDEVVVVRSRPPVDRIESPGFPPDGGYVWVRGRWVMTSRGWAWRSGHWAPSRSGHVYVPGRWARRDHRWVWIPGRWRAA